MSQNHVTSEDHRRAFISSIFFAIILTDGLTKFVENYIKTDNFKGDLLLNLHNFIMNYINFDKSAQSELINILFFAVTFFWIVSHWIFYHQLITRYPYYRWRKFLVDIAVFSIMFVTLRLSLRASDPNIFSIFVLLVAVWYALCSLWHFSDRGLRPVRQYSDFLVIKSIVYFSILILFIISENPVIKYTLMISVIVLIMGFNIDRLNKFITKKEKVSHCCIFYNVGNQEIIRNPSFMAYPPQMYAVELFDTYYKKNGRDRKDVVHIRDRAAEAVELLIYCWLSRMTNFYDANYCFPIKRIPIKSMTESLTLQDNVFLQILSSDESMEAEGIINITLPEDITVIRNSQRYNGRNYPTTGTIAIKRKHFDLTIKYKESNYRRDLKSPSLPLRVSKSLYANIAGIPINPIYLGDRVFKELSNIGWTVYRIEFHGDAKLSTRIRSIFSTSASDELDWLDLMADNFNDFFDIDMHIDRVEKAH